MSPPIDPRELIAERRRREEHFPQMTERAWFMLLGLVVAADEGRKLTSVEAATSSFGSITSGLRHLGWLVEEGLAQRSVDPQDARRHLVGLTATGARRLTAYLEGKPTSERGRT